jgi:heptosyltransferase-2
LHPVARVVAGVGTWNFEVLKGNPYVDEILAVNAPWHNKFIRPQSLWRSLRYIYGSAEARELRRRRFDVGIDVLGSPFGSLLLLRAGIPWRLGVRGYAGGHLGIQQYVDYSPEVGVGRASLRFAELLGARSLPSPRPQVYLEAGEERRGLELWVRAEAGGAGKRLRVVVGPGGGLKEKCWPEERYAVLASRVAEGLGAVGVVVGGPQDREAGSRIAAGTAGAFVNLAGALSLRETFAVVRYADLVVCNSSMLMHASAAFGVHAFVLLGPHFGLAEEHARLWGHGELTTELGKDAGHTQMWEAEEACEAIRRYCKQHFAGRTTG